MGDGDGGPPADQVLQSLSSGEHLGTCRLPPSIGLGRQAKFT